MKLKLSTPKKVKEILEDIKTASKRVLQFIEASSLLIAAIYTGWASLSDIRTGNPEWYVYLYFFAAVVIGLRAAHEYWKHFTGKN